MATRRQGIKRREVPPGVWLAVGLLTLCGMGGVVRPDAWRPEVHAGTDQAIVFAYKQWQSTGVKLEPGDSFTLRAQGQWAYSPIVGLHGPIGGRPAVASYPMPHALGGALLGRVGDFGQPFVVGTRMIGRAETGGFLFLRINDDLLGDNQGEMTVAVEVIRATPTPRP